MKRMPINPGTKLPQSWSRTAFRMMQDGVLARLLRWTKAALVGAAIAAGANTASAGTRSGASPAVPLPSVVEAPATGTPMSATVMPLQPSDYVEKEYFIRGQANRYRISDPMQDAQQIDSGNPYVTRVLVRRPTDPARFNGTVVVEWLNVSLD